MNKILKELLYDRLLIREHTRESLRLYGEHVRTIRNPNGFDSGSVDRACRHLTKEGKIEPKKIRGFNVAYRVVVGAKLSHTGSSKRLNPPEYAWDMPKLKKSAKKVNDLDPKPLFIQEREAKALKEKNNPQKKLL